MRRVTHNPDPRHVQDYHFHVAAAAAERLAETKGRAPSLPDLSRYLWSFYGPTVFHTQEYAQASARAAVTGRRMVRKFRRRR